MMDRHCLRYGSQDIWRRRPRIVCNDGISLSVQAGANLYSTPRTDTDQYTHVEVGLISSPNDKLFRPDDEWEQYSDGEFPSDVYGYVPIDVVERFIAKHGGRKYFT